MLPLHFYCPPVAASLRCCMLLPLMLLPRCCCFAANAVVFVNASMLQWLNADAVHTYVYVQVANAALPVCPIEPGFHMHWLAVDGQQPLLPQNPVPSAGRGAAAQPGTATRPDRIGSDRMPRLLAC